MTVYERPEHREAQQRVVEAIARQLGLLPWHRPTLAPFDGYLVTPRPKALAGAVEVKVRTCARVTYPTCVVDVAKVDALLASRRTDAWLALFAVRWVDALGVITAERAAACPTRPFSLTRPRDAGDVGDRVYDIPIEAFADWSCP